MSVVPAAFASAEAARCGGDEIDQVVVGVRDGWPTDFGPVAHVEPHAPGAGDVDVPHLRVVEQRLKPGEAVDAVEHRGGDLRFGCLVEGRPTVAVRARGEVSQLVAYQLASQRPFVAR